MSLPAGVHGLAREVPGQAQQEGGAPDGRDQHGPEAAGQGQHCHWYPREVGHPLSALEAAQECPEHQPVRGGRGPPHRGRERGMAWPGALPVMGSEARDEVFCQQHSA